MTGQEGRYVYVVRPDNTVENRLVTLGPSVWKAPPPLPGVTVPSWTLVNPNPAPSEGQQAAGTGPPTGQVDGRYHGRSQTRRSRDRRRHPKSAADPTCHSARVELTRPLNPATAPGLRFCVFENDPA